MARVIDYVSDPVDNIAKTFGRLRTSIIDSLDSTEKQIFRLVEDNEEVRLANNTADTATMAALRMQTEQEDCFKGCLREALFLIQ